MNEERLAFKRPVVKVDADDLDAIVSIKSAQMRLQAAESVVEVRPWPEIDCCLPPARVVVKTVGAHVVVSSVLPTEQSTGRMVYSDVEGAFDLRLALAPSAPLKSSKRRVAGSSDVPDFIAMQSLEFGFLLGYFYPIIRSSNGLWKGLSVAVTCITPWLIYNLIIHSVYRQTAWQPIVVWAAQVFVTCILTGFLAGEVKTLRNAGYGINSLMSVHNFSVLAAWGSSVAVAIIGAIVTLLTTTIGQVVTSQVTGGPKPPAVP